MISIIIPICNTEQYIAQYIRMTGRWIKKNTYNNIRNGRKNWSRLCGNGNATSHGSLWGGKKTGLSPVNGLIQQPKLFNKYYISFFGINIFYPLICGENSTKIFIKCSQYTANSNHYRGRTLPLISIISIFI